MEGEGQEDEEGGKIRARVRRKGSEGEHHQWSG